MQKIVLFLLLFAFFSCADKEQVSAVETPVEKFDVAVVKQYIDSMNKFYGDRFYKSDINWFKERYCADASVLPDKWKRVEGVDSLMSFFYAGGTNKETQILITATSVYGSADLVVEEGTYAFPDGQGGNFDEGKFMALWKQEAGKWKMYREIWNSNVYPKAVSTPAK